MKKFIFVALFIATTAGLVAGEYQPTEGWPYLYDQFTPAIVYYDNGKAESADINVHLLNNSLHFVDGELIKVVHDPHHIDSVVCENNDVLLYKGNLYILRVAATPHIVIGTTSEVDLNSLTESNGAYGNPTTTAATQNIASFRDHGNIAAQRYQEMIADRHNTRTLSTTDRIVLVINDREICQANKRGVNSILDKDQKNAFKAFLKENKIKWKETADLLLVAQFLESILVFE